MKPQVIPMFHLNPKYLIVAYFPRVAPYVIASMPVEPWYADIATEKQWADRTPELLWIPAETVGVLRWLGWIGRRSSQTGLKLTASQQRILEDLPHEIAPQIGVNREIELAVGVARADARFPADPAWIPEIEEAQAVLGALVRFWAAKPWEGYRAPVYDAPPKDRAKPATEAKAEPEAKASAAGKRAGSSKPKRETAKGPW